MNEAFWKASPYSPFILLKTRFKDDLHSRMQIQECFGKHDWCRNWATASCICYQIKGNFRSAWCLNFELQSGKGHNCFIMFSHWESKALSTQEIVSPSHFSSRLLGYGKLWVLILPTSLVVFSVRTWDCQIEKADICVLFLWQTDWSWNTWCLLWDEHV